jgi:hypothetical protein
MSDEDKNTSINSKQGILIRTLTGLGIVNEEKITEIPNQNTITSEIPNQNTTNNDLELDKKVVQDITDLAVQLALTN